ncbi:hypothetical protein [Streptomyces sp. NRRL F-2580]|nr:hypothetical protein [Streptomyces sp. NRRL F-2580]
MEMNRPMARLLGRVDTEGIAPGEAPPGFLRIAEARVRGLLAAAA